MKKYANGEYIDLTTEEIAAMQAERAAYEAYERTRPLTESEALSLLLKQQVNALEVDDNMACRMKEFYPEWAAGQAYAAGYKVQHNGKLWKCKEPGHTSQAGWGPSVNTASLWTEICETHAGTLADPIPFDGNMELTAGLYYTQGGVTYLCNRSTGQPVYNALSELVGLYVEVAEQSTF